MFSPFVDTLTFATDPDAVRSPNDVMLWRSDRICVVRAITWELSDFRRARETFLWRKKINSPFHATTHQHNVPFKQGQAGGQSDTIEFQAGSTNIWRDSENANKPPRFPLHFRHAFEKIPTLWICASAFLPMKRLMHPLAACCKKFHERKSQMRQ